MGKRRNRRRHDEKTGAEKWCLLQLSEGMQEADNVYANKSTTNMCVHAFNLYEYIFIRIKL